MSSNTTVKQTCSNPRVVVSYDATVTRTLKQDNKFEGHVRVSADSTEAGEFLSAVCTNCQHSFSSAFDARRHVKGQGFADEG